MLNLCKHLFWCFNPLEMQLESFIMQYFYIFRNLHVLCSFSILSSYILFSYIFLIVLNNNLHLLNKHFLCVSWSSSLSCQALYQGGLNSFTVCPSRHCSLHLLSLSCISHMDATSYHASPPSWRLRLQVKNST